jgi:hypothetical protein
MDTTAAEALADLRELLASPLTTRPTRERLTARAITYLERIVAVDAAISAFAPRAYLSVETFAVDEVAGRPAVADPPGDGQPRR